MGQVVLDALRESQAHLDLVLILDIVSSTFLPVSHSLSCHRLLSGFRNHCPVPSLSLLYSAPMQMPASLPAAHLLESFGQAFLKPLWLGNHFFLHYRQLYQKHAVIAIA